MRVYIAGPMSGRVAYNVDKFRAAATALQQLGHTTVIPHDLNSEIWRKHYKRDFDPTQDVCDCGDPLLREMMTHDFMTLCACDAVALLPDWAFSRGARAEVILAQHMSIPLLDAVTGKEITPLLRTWERHTGFGDN